MRLSTKGRYGLRLMLELALQEGRGPVSVGLLEARQGISGKYVHVLMGGLKAAGLVRASRGPAGGYELARPSDRITVLEVVLALEGDLAVVDCLQDPACCTRTKVCAAREVWGELAEALRGTLAQRTLADLAARQRTLTPGVEAPGGAHYVI